MKNRKLHIGLILAGAVCTFASQVKLPALVPFSEALAGLGFTLAMWAEKGALFPARREPPTDRGADLGKAG